MQPDPANPEGAWPTAPPGSAGFRAAFPLAHEVPARTQLTGRYPMVALLLAGLTLLTLVLVLVAKVAPPAPPAPCKRGSCEHPPPGHVLSGVSQALPGPALYGSEVSYTSPTGFSLRYWPRFGASGGPNLDRVVPTYYKQGVKLSFEVSASSGSSPYLEILGERYSASAPDLVAAVAQDLAPGATLAYTVPGAWVGYEPGFGEAFDYEPPFSFTSAGEQRIIVLASVVDGFAIVVVASGALLSPVGPNDLWWDGHPSPADLSVAYLADGPAGGEIVNSIQFPRK